VRIQGLAPLVNTVK